MRKTIHYQLICLITLLVMIAVSLAYLSFGHTDYALTTVLATLLGQSSQGYFTIKLLKMPQIMVGILAGMAFGIGGNLFQRLFHNPLASPDILGISTSASIGAMIGIMFFQLSGLSLSLLALISSLLGAFLIFYLGRGSSSKMILSGIALQFMGNALISWMQVLGNDYNLDSAMRFLTGSLNDANSSDAIILLVVILIVGLLIKIFSRDFELLKLGEELPLVLGQNKTQKRMFFLSLGVLLVAFATAITGPIASVAFIAGPISAKITTNHKSNMLLSGLIGALIVIFAQLLAANVLPYRYPVGVVTALLGAPYLIILLIRQKGAS